jgi:hypothetical protein
MMKGALSDVTKAIGNTPIVKLNKIGAHLAPHVELYAKLEYFNPLSSVKDRLAIAVIEDAEKKGLLKPGIAAINRALMDTLAACGDVNRNVMCTANPEDGALHAAALDLSLRLSAHLSPRTTAYAEVWLDEKLVAGGAVDVEPVYGATYLPRKFKIGVAVPPDNDVDVYTQDLSFVAMAGGGFGVLVGGGGTDMGAGLTAVAESKPHITVVTTDGDTGWPTRQPAGTGKVVVCLTRPTHCSTPSWATVVKAYEKQD